MNISQLKLRSEKFDDDDDDDVDDDGNNSVNQHFPNYGNVNWCCVKKSRYPPPNTPPRDLLLNLNVAYLIII